MHFQRPPGWDWPAGAASPAPPRDKSETQEHYCNTLIGGWRRSAVGGDWWDEVVQGGYGFGEVYQKIITDTAITSCKMTIIPY